MVVVTAVPIVRKTGTHGEAFLPCGRNIPDFRCDGLLHAVTEGLCWQAATFREGDFQAGSCAGSVPVPPAALNQAMQRGSGERRSWASASFN